MSSSYSLQTGLILDGRFEIIGLIGSGGVGTVYSAKQFGLDRLVAVKVPHLVEVESVEGKKRFLREGRILSRLKHPNIPEFYHFGLLQERLPFMVFELLSGKSLRTLLNERDMLSWQETCLLTINICAALDYAHLNGIVHRDIKPDNIFITAPDDTVKVIDFGLSTLSDLEKSQQLTQTGLLVGSIYYMSPEQCRGERATHLSDIYSVGCVMFECISGETVFSCDNPLGLLHKHTNELPRSLASVCPERVAEGVAEVVLRALAKNPQDRYQSAGEMARALTDLLSRSEFARAVARPFPRKKACLVLAAIAMMTLALVLPVVAISSDEGLSWIYFHLPRSDPEMALQCARGLRAIGCDDRALQLTLLAVPDLDSQVDSELPNGKLTAVCLLTDLGRRVSEHSRGVAFKNAMRMMHSRMRHGQDKEDPRELVNAARQLGECIADDWGKRNYNVYQLGDELGTSGQSDALYALVWPLMSRRKISGKDECELRTLLTRALSFQQRRITALEQMKAVMGKSDSLPNGYVHFRIQGAHYALCAADLDQADRCSRDILSTTHHVDHAHAYYVLSQAQLLRGNAREAAKYAHLASKVVATYPAFATRVYALRAVTFAQLAAGDFDGAAQSGLKMESLLKVDNADFSSALVLDKRYLAAVCVMLSRPEAAWRIIDRWGPVSDKLFCERLLLKLYGGRTADIELELKPMKSDVDRLIARQMLGAYKAALQGNFALADSLSGNARFALANTCDKPCEHWMAQDLSVVESLVHSLRGETTAARRSAHLAVRLMLLQTELTDNSVVVPLVMSKAFETDASEQEKGGRFQRNQL